MKRWIRLIGIYQLRVLFTFYINCKNQDSIKSDNVFGRLSVLDFALSPGLADIDAAASSIRSTPALLILLTIFLPDSIFG